MASFTASVTRHSAVLALLAVALIQIEPSAAFLPTNPTFLPPTLKGRCRAACRANIVMKEQQPDSKQEPSLWLPSRREVVTISVGSVLAASTFLPSVAAASQGRDLPSNSVADPSGGSVKLKNGGGKFPLMSFGLQVYDNDTAKKLTLLALECGVRNFFSSVLAGNQKGFAQAIKESGIPRDQIYICGSVVSNRAVGADKAYKATTKGWQENMKEFSAGNIQYLDQIMLDYPGKDAPSILGQWKAFQEMHEQGLTKSLSVSNFSPEQIDFILDDEDTTVKPCVNQLPLNLATNGKISGWGGGARAVVQSNKDRGCLVQAWAPLGSSTGGFNSKIKSTCDTLGKKYGKTGSQMALRWLVECGAAFTTETKKKEHFVEDLNIFDFKLEPEDFLTLDTLVGRVAVQ